MNNYLVRKLLVNNANPNIQNNNGDTVLHRAVLHKNNLNTIKLLVKNKADTNIQNTNNKYPLDNLYIVGYNTKMRKEIEELYYEANKH